MSLCPPCSVEDVNSFNGRCHEGVEPKDRPWLLQELSAG